MHGHRHGRAQVRKQKVVVAALKSLGQCLCVCVRFWCLDCVHLLHMFFSAEFLLCTHELHMI